MRRGGYASLVLGFVCCHTAQANEIDVTYGAGHSFDDNYFFDTNNMAAQSYNANLGLRGSLDIDGGKIGYAVSHEEVRVPKYRFAEEHNTQAEISLTKAIGEKLEFAAKVSGIRSDAGDIFLKLPEEVLGYRRLDHKIDATTGLTLTALGGKNTVTFNYSNLLKGKAYFRPAYILPARLEANEAAFGIKADHIRPFASGELGFALAYNESVIRDSQQQRFERFPARTLRGSVAFGRKISENFAFLTEAGLTTISSAHISDTVQHTRPYVRAEVEWKANDIFAFGGAFSQDYALVDMDDPIAEFERRWKVVMKTTITDNISVDLGFERTYSEWLYYDYGTGEKNLFATLSFETGNNRKLEFEFSRLLHDEKDADFNYSGNTIASRFSGTF